MRPKKAQTRSATPPTRRPVQVHGQPPGGSDEDDASKDEEGYGLQGEFNVDYAEYGVLQSVFVIGLLVGAPIFSELSKPDRKELISVSLHPS